MFGYDLNKMNSAYKMTHVLVWIKKYKILINSKQNQI